MCRQPVPGRSLGAVQIVDNQRATQKTPAITRQNTAGRDFFLHLHVTEAPRHARELVRHNADRFDRESIVGEPVAKLSFACIVWKIPNVDRPGHVGGAPFYYGRRAVEIYVRLQSILTVK